MEVKNVSVLSRPGFQDTLGNGFIQNAIAIARKSFFGHGLESTGFSSESKYVDPSSSGTYYRRELIKEAEYFDEEFDAVEDFEFNYRLHKMGYKSYTAPELTIYYFPRDSLIKLFHQMSRYGIGRCRFMYKHPEAFSLTYLIPVVFLLGLPILLLLSLFLPFMLNIAIGVYGFYLGTNLLFSTFLSIKNSFKYIAVLPVIFPIIHISLGWGLFSRNRYIYF